MPKRIYTGDAPKAAQIERHRLAGQAGESAYLKAAIGRKSIEVVSGGEAVEDSLLTLAQSLASAWNESPIPEFAEVTASAATDPNGVPYLELEGDTAGVPFEVTLTAPRPTIDVDTIQQGGPGQNEIQTYSITPAPAGGVHRVRWDLGSGVETSASIPAADYADPAVVKAALVAGMASLTADNVLVSGAATVADPIRIELTDDLAETGVGQLSIDVSDLTGNGEVTITTLQEGGDVGSGGNVVTDTFTDSDSVALTSHSADTAQTYSAGDGSLTGCTIQGNKLEVDCSGIDVGPNTAVLSGNVGADFVAQLTVRRTTGTTQNEAVGLMFRRTDDANYLHAYVYFVGSVGKVRVYIYKTEGNVETVLAQEDLPADMDNNTDHTLTLTVSGNDIDAFLEGNGASVTASAASGFNSSAQVCGLAFRASEQTSVFTADGLTFDATIVNDEQWSIHTNGAGGTFDIDDDPALSSPQTLSAGATTAQVKAALESLYGGSTFTVTGSGVPADPWIATDDTGTNLTQPTGDGTDLTGGFDAVVDTVQDGHAARGEKYEVRIHDATGGNLQLAYLGEFYKTANIAHGAAAAAVEAALEATDSVEDATVTGAGTDGDPYVIELVGASDVGTDQPQLEAFNVDLTGPASITITKEVVQASAGPHHWGHPLNWIDPVTALAGVPETGDDAYLMNGDEERCLKYDMDQSAVALNSLYIHSNYDEGAQLGLERWNANGYEEYRERALKIAFQGDIKCTIGPGQGGGSEMLNLDSLATQVALRIVRTAGPKAGEFRAVQWIGTHADNTVEVLDGSFGAGVWPGEEYTIAALTHRGGQVFLGAGASAIPAIDSTAPDELESEIDGLLLAG